jgi:hypothetical protein
MRENDNAQRITMSDRLAAAVIGGFAGYLIARHTREIAWILHALMG